MAIQTINIGTNANDGTGDDLRTAFDKVNDNFAELLAVGGETNTASNLGIGEGVFKIKDGLNFQFKTLRNTDGKIAITSDGNSVYLDTSNLADNDFGVVQVDNGDTITASQSGAIVGIKGGDNITTERSGTDVIIASAFEVVNDTTPQLGGDLSLLSNSIIGPGNVTAITAFDSDSVQTDTLTVNTTTTVNGTATFNAPITATGGLTLGAGQTISGNISGGLEGQLTGTLDINAQTISGDGNIVIDVASLATPGQLGTEYGTSYRTIAAPMTVQTGVDLPSNFVTVSTNTNVPQFPLNIEHVVDKTQTGGSTYSAGFGAGIQFSVNDSDSNSLTTAVVVSGPVDSIVNEIQLLPLQTGKAAIAQPQYFRFNSSGVATLNEIDISETGITTNVSNKNLTLSANGSGKVDFYGAYQFPDSIGNAGEVLQVPLSGTELTWGAGGGGGGGASAFVGLSDTPSSYAGGAGDALKFVRVASGGTSLEFVTLTSIVNNTYIDSQGGLLKAGGVMTGNLDLGTNNINNIGSISTTSITGSLTGDVKGSVFGDDSTPIVDAVNNSLNGNLVGDVTGDLLGDVTGDIKGSGGNVVVNSNTGPADAEINVLNITATGTINGNVTGNITGDTTGYHTGDIKGSVFGDDSTPIVDAVNNTLNGNLTGDVTGNVVGNLTGNVDGILGGSTPAAVTGTVITANTNFAGPLTGNVTGNLAGTNIDVDYANIGSIRVENNSIETANSNENLRLASLGTGSIELDGNVHVPGKFAFTGGEDRTITGTATPITLSADTYASFITTADWTAVGAEFGYADLPNGTQDGQIKMIKVVSRGQYINTAVGPTPVDRYLVVNLELNGATTTFNISENSEYGAATFIWHNSSWWVVSHFDS